MSLQQRARHAIAWRSRAVADRSRALLESWLPHDWVYGSSYFAGIDSEATQSAAAMADGIVRFSDPRSCIDVGCGTGAFLSALRNRHPIAVRGLEYGKVAREYCHQRGLDVGTLDLSDPELAIAAGSVDLVTSFEVAEHLSARLADRFVTLLTSARTTIIMSAAVPGQGGTGHINEQPREYWIERMEFHGFRYDPDGSRELADWWRAGGATWWYWQNVAVYRPA